LYPTSPLNCGISFSRPIIASNLPTLESNGGKDKDGIIDRLTNKVTDTNTQTHKKISD